MKKGKTLDHKCPACAAPLLFNPKLGKWKCQYCDNIFSLEDLEVHKHEIPQNADNVQYDSYSCKNCGAEIVADENTAATFCLYCGNTAILKNKLSGEFKPSKLIPFKVVKEDAIAAFKALKKGRPLLPRDFISEKNIEKITGLYVPFWLFDLSYDGTVEASAKKIKHWSIGNTHYTKTDTYRLERELSMNYQLVPVDGSKKFSDDIMNTIEPFDYSELMDYNHAYLSGFLAEKYDLNSEDAANTAKERALNSTLDEARRSMQNYNSVNISNYQMNATEKNIEYALLPVWMVNVKYKDKYYLFAMNGQTGEFIGDMPLNKGKTVIMSILIFVILFLCSILITYLFYKMSGGMV